MSLRRSYHSWDAGDEKIAMDAAVAAKLSGDDPLAAAREVVPGILIPRTTLFGQVQAEKRRRAAATDGSGGKQTPGST